MSDSAFDITNTLDWAKIHQDIFLNVIPTSATWTGTQNIIDILNIIGSSKNTNHLFFPDGGGLDLLGAGHSYENGCIELHFGTDYIIKPKKLTFEAINDSQDFNYFRIEADILERTKINGFSTEKISEQLCELSPAKYVQSHHWDENEYNGQKLPDSARRIIRYFEGSFVIFKKSSPYNKITSTYDGRHYKFYREDSFRKYVEKLAS